MKPFSTASSVPFIQSQSTTFVAGTITVGMCNPVRYDDSGSCSAFFFFFFLISPLLLVVMFPHVVYKCTTRVY